MKNPLRFLRLEEIQAFGEAHPELWRRTKPARNVAFRFLKTWRASGPGKACVKARYYVARKAAERRLPRKLTPSAKELQEQRETVFPETHRFSILVPLYNTPLDFLQEMISSVQDQTYGDWELCLADGSDDSHPEVGETCREMSRQDPRIVYRKLEENKGISENTNACMEMATGDWLALFDHDDLLHPSALFEMMKVICSEGADFIYTDELVFKSPDKRKIFAIHFKPDFAYDNLLSNNYICHFSAFRKELTEQAGRFRKECDGSQDHDIILRLTGCAEKVAHIPKILYYWRSHANSTASDIGTKTYAVLAGRRAVHDFLLQKEGIEAEVTSTEAFPTMYHVARPLRGEPAVEVLVYSAGATQDRETLEERAEALRRGTDWRNLRVAVVPEDGETASLPARLNKAARASEAEYIVFLNGELEVTQADWAREMLMLAQEERIGAVGAKTMFRDGSVRNAGLILGFGRKRVVGCSHFRAEGSSAGYFGQMAIAEDVSAVSAGFMMTERRKLEAAGWLDEGYAETLFDADLCLKLARAGYVNVYTPFAEGKGGGPQGYYLDYGREKESYDRDAARFKAAWAETLARPDPYYNVNLTLDFPDYSAKRGV